MAATKEILHLTLKKKWFDMIASGEKKEEYRELKQYWVTRLTNGIGAYLTNFLPQGFGYEVKWKHFDYIEFKNGYAKDAPTITVECNGIEIGEAKPEWSDNWQGEVFIIKLGNVITKSDSNET